jgi:hypothetical protein
VLVLLVVVCGFVVGFLLGVGLPPSVGIPEPGVGASAGGTIGG